MMVRKNDAKEHEEMAVLDELKTRDAKREIEVAAEKAALRQERIDARKLENRKFWIQITTAIVAAAGFGLSVYNRFVPSTEKPGPTGIHAKPAIVIDPTTNPPADAITPAGGN